MAAPGTVDYGRIEPGWREGLKSVPQLAAEYTAATGQPITQAAIRKHFVKIGVPRDLSAKIKAKADKPVVLEEDEFSEQGFIYVIYLDSVERYYKIGMAKAFNHRFSAHQCSSPFQVCVACCFFVPNMRTTEKYLHNKFANKRVRGEWFSLDNDDLREIAIESLLVQIEE